MLETSSSNGLGSLTLPAAPNNNGSLPSSPSVDGFTSSNGITQGSYTSQGGWDTQIDCIDKIGFSHPLYTCIDEADGIFDIPIQIERKGINSTPCKVRIIFAKPSSGYEQERFPLEENTLTVAFGKGETGLKTIPVMVKPNQVHNLPLLLQIIVSPDSKSGTQVDPERETAALKVISYGQASAFLKSQADIYYSERNVMPSREGGRFQRPVVG